MMCYQRPRALRLLLGAFMGLALSLPRYGESAKADESLNVLTNRYNSQRTGADLQETVLTPGTVNQNSFSKLSAYRVQGNIYAQPLYMSNVDIHTGDAVRDGGQPHHNRRRCLKRPAMRRMNGGSTMSIWTTLLWASLCGSSPTRQRN